MMKEKKSPANTTQPLDKFTRVPIVPKEWVLGKPLKFAITAFYRLNVPRVMINSVKML